MGRVSSSRTDVPGTRLPSLGRRGEGWIGIQVALELAVLVGAPFTTIPAPDGMRLVLLGVGLVLVGGGIVLFMAGAAELGRGFSVYATPTARATLTVSGPYRWMRHPICTAQVVLLTGWSVLSVSPAGLLGTVVVVAYLERFKLVVEEAWLRDRYPGYAEYEVAVPHRMLPFGGRFRAPAGRGRASR